jgi:prepilin-type N-terminal cleavage/methylation domain-containing protein
MVYLEIYPFGRPTEQGSAPCGVGTPVYWENKVSGFTLVEILIVLALIATLSYIVIPSALGITERTRNMQVMADLSKMNADIDQYIMDYNVPPNSLADVGYGSLLDPWQPVPIPQDLRKLRSWGEWKATERPLARSGQLGL